jgi:hypothetical protein
MIYCLTSLYIVELEDDYWLWIKMGLLVCWVGLFVSYRHCISLKGLFKIHENISPPVGLKPKELMRCVVVNLYIAM